MKRLALALVAALSLAAPASAGFDSRSAPVRLRISGYVGEKPADVTPLARWRIDAAGQQYTFTADKMDVLVGNTSYMDVVEALEPYVPAFRLSGVDEAIRAFTATKPGQHIALQGVLRFGGGTSRLFMLDTVTALPPVTPH